MHYTLHLTNDYNLSCKYCGAKKNRDYLNILINLLKGLSTKFNGNLHKAAQIAIATV